MVLESAPPTDTPTTENGTTFADKTTNTTPTRIQHKKSALLTINLGKQEQQIIETIHQQMAIRPHAVIQLNNAQPYNYQITFETEQHYLQSLPQKLQYDNKSFTLQPLASARIQISVMRVDAELDDKDVDLAFVKYGKIVEGSKKLYKSIAGVGPVHLGNRLLTLELSNPDVTPPNSIFLTPGIQSQTLFTVPGTNKTNQALAFEQRVAKRTAAAEEEERERKEKERIHAEQDREEQERIARETLQQDLSDIDRDDLANRAPAPVGTENTNNSPDGVPPQDVLTTPPPPPPPTAANITPENSTEPTANITEQFNIAKCEVCSFDLCAGFLHVTCGTQEQPETTEDLLADRHCEHGAAQLREQLKTYSETRDPEQISGNFLYIIQNSHEQYFRSLIHALGLQNTLSPVSMARIVFFSAIERTPDNQDTCKVHLDTLQSVNHHHDIARAFKDLKLLPSREATKLPYKPHLVFANNILDGCVRALEIEQ